MEDTVVTCTSTAVPSVLSLSSSGSPQEDMMIFLEKAHMEEMYLGEIQCPPPVQYVYCPKVEH